MRTIFLRCNQCSGDDLTATLYNGRLITESDSHGCEMLTEAELIEIRRHTLNGDFASPPIHEALLIKAFCLLTDSQRDDGLLMEWRGNRFTYTQKEITDQEVYDD